MSTSSLQQVNNLPFYITTGESFCEKTTYVPFVGAVISAIMAVALKSYVADVKKPLENRLYASELRGRLIKVATFNYILSKKAFLIAAVAIELITVKTAILHSPIIFALGYIAYKAYHENEAIYQKLQASQYPQEGLEEKSQG